MPILTLKFKGKTVNEYPIEFQQHRIVEKPVTIGRRADNVMFIDNMAVSGYHARIDPTDKGFLLVDLNSSNGTFLNGQQVKTSMLHHGDTITIGKHTIIFTYTPGESKPDFKSGKIVDTVYVDPKKFREMIGSSDSKILKKNDKKSIAVLHFLEGSEGEIALSKELTKIGKDPASDIVVDGFMVGKTAATISKRNGSYQLIYTGGISKPKVNQKKVIDSVSLQDNDIIQVGSTKMQLKYSEAGD